MNDIDQTQSHEIFFHLCKNLKAFINIQDGRFESFLSISDELYSLHNRNVSHLGPIIQSNLHYLKKYTDERLWDTDGHYENVLLYHESRELDHLDNLKNASQRMVSNEVYENIDVYGKDTVRFNNTPNSVSKKLSRFIFLHSFMGSNSGFSEGCNLLLRAFFSFADMYKDQSLYREALRNAVHLGSQKDIEKIVRFPSFIKDAHTIAYFEKLISENPYRGSTAIGISYLIKNTYLFITEKSAPLIVSHLKREIQGEFSFSASFDHARPALEALYFVLHTIPKDKGLDLFQAFIKVIERIPMNMIGLDSLNKVANNLPEELIKSDAESTNTLINFYLKNIESALKMHYEDTMLCLSLLVRNSNVSANKVRFLELLSRESSQPSINDHRKVFLIDRFREIEESLSETQSADLGNLIVDKVLSPSSERYSTESFGGFDSLLISTNSFDTMPTETQNRYLDKLLESLFDSRASISNKTRILKAIGFLSKKIDSKYFSQIDEFISKNRTNLFASAKTENRSPFLSDSFVNFRALLYSCASHAPVKKPISFSVDMLRLSVSTESRVRELFAESVVSFIRSNPNCSGNLSLLNRCYELTFDPDPKVRGQAISSILDLFDDIDEELKETYLLRVLDLSSDPSEITRAYLALCLNKFKTKISTELFSTLKVKLEKDVSFYVRRNITTTESWN